MPKENNNARLEHRLVLASWFADKLGYDDAVAMLEDNQSADDTGADSPSPVFRRIESRGGRGGMPLGELAEMDAAVRGDLKSINHRRGISLKYFQYLAALSSEYFLRRRKESPAVLEEELNKFADYYNRNKAAAERFPKYLEPAHLSKLAFWMATGAGKTLLMHLNYHQALRYLDFEPGNVVLVTPNADMTAQHINELRASGIPCHRHDEGGGALAGKNAVCVIDIHKLSVKPGKKGDTVHPSYFEGPNLVFVDEGHKGVGSGREEKGFLERKGKLAEGGGFSFEYSATFGQAISKEERAEEYGRAVAFDYSYRHFYNDKYGKDFFVLNTDDNADKTDRMLLGNLLAFFQQRLAYDKYPAQAREFNIEAPLLLMLGASVTGGRNENKNETEREMQTDIVRIVNFLHRALSNRKWLVKETEKIIGGKSGIKNADTGEDLFAEKFKLLNGEYKGNAEELCKAMCKAVFNNADGGMLRFCTLRKTARRGGQSEIALRAGEGKPFALVYVGDSRKLCEIVAEGAGKVKVEDDLFQNSLFSSINDGDSPVNILIGAKKFMEGWSSWRVCGIGLLNVGRGEGPLIIQLFGRGVRLQGRGLSLKRNEGLPRELQARDAEADALALLETLNIFAVRAKFMAAFRDYLKREGVVFEPVELKVRETKGLNPPPLPVPDMPKPEEFDKYFSFADCKGEARLDLTTKVTVQSGMGGGAQAAAEGEECEFNDDVCKRINFGEVYMRLLEGKNTDGDITVVSGELEGALRKCRVFTDKDDQLKDFDRPRLQQTALAVLHKFAANNRARLFRQWQWQKENITAGKLNIGDKNKRPNLADYAYTLRLPDGEVELARKIRKLIKGGGKLFTGDGAGDGLPRLYYERHLFQPLLLDAVGGGVKMTPPGLNKGEVAFVKALKEYVADNPLPKGAEVYILRNLPHAGIGFALEESMFYPDFIMWIIRKGEKPRVVFVDPHGMVFADSYDYDGKARLWENLQKLELDFDVDSYIVSVTSYEKMRRKWGRDWNAKKFADKHILFAEDLEKPQTRAKCFAALLGLPQH